MVHKACMLCYSLLDSEVKFLQHSRDKASQKNCKSLWNQLHSSCSSFLISVRESLLTDCCRMSMRCVRSSLDVVGVIIFLKRSIKRILVASSLKKRDETSEYCYQKTEYQNDEFVFIHQSIISKSPFWFLIWFVSYWYSFWHSFPRPFRVYR